VYRAKQSGSELDAETSARLLATLTTHEAEAARLEQQLHDIGASRPDAPSAEASSAPPPPSSPPPPPSAADAPPAPEAPVI